MDAVRAVTTPVQQAKFFLWVESNPAMAQMLNSVWLPPASAAGAAGAASVAAAGGAAAAGLHSVACAPSAPVPAPSESQSRGSHMAPRITHAASGSFATAAASNPAPADASDAASRVWTPSAPHFGVHTASPLGGMLATTAGFPTVQVGAHAAMETDMLGMRAMLPAHAVQTALRQGVSRCSALSPATLAMFSTLEPLTVASVRSPLALRSLPTPLMDMLPAGPTLPPLSSAAAAPTLASSTAGGTDTLEADALLADDDVWGMLGNADS